MAIRANIIDKYALDVSLNTAERLDEIARLENIENDWNEEKYISFDVVSDNVRRFNFYGMDKDIYFQRKGNTNYFKLINVSNEFAELENLLNYVCNKFENNCVNCPYKKECEQYSKLYFELFS